MEVPISGVKKGTPTLPLTDMDELFNWGDGKVAYIRAISSDTARALFPNVLGIPDDTELFSLHAANGRPITLARSRLMALGLAKGDKLEIASVN